MFPGVPILDSLFWMIFGALQILIIAGGYSWVAHMGKKISWWKMAMLYGVFALFQLTVGAGFTLMGEFESQAGWYVIGVAGVPLIIFFAILLKMFVFQPNQKTA